MMKAFAKQIPRILLLIAGILALVFLIRKEGAAHLWALLVAARWHLPMLLLLEVLFVAGDAIAVAILLSSSAKKVPIRDWIRSTAMAYGFMVLLPAGRAAGEIGRASVLGPWVTLAAAASAGAELQGLAVLSNAALSLLSALTCLPRFGLFSIVTASMFANTVVLSVLGFGLLALPRSRRLRGWFEKRFPKSLASFADRVTTPARVLLTAFAACFIGRLFQTWQFGVMVEAISGVPISVLSSIDSQGVHLVGATLGDLVPGQVGVVEGCYVYFSPILKLANDSASALAIPLVGRVAQLTLACTSVILAFAIPVSKPPKLAQDSPPNA
jgi:hypothetical protein